MLTKNLLMFLTYLDVAESKLYDVTQGNIKKSSESAQNLVIQAKKRIEDIAKARWSQWSCYWF